MIWALAALYLIVEGREITQLRQLTTFSIFAVLFVVGSFQIKVSRLLLSVSSRKEASDAYRASIRMFLASLLAVIDGCMDVAISGITASVTPLLPPRILGLSWDHDRREIQLVDQIEQEIHLMVSSQPVTR